MLIHASICYCSQLRFRMHYIHSAAPQPALQRPSFCARILISRLCVYVCLCERALTVLFLTRFHSGIAFSHAHALPVDRCGNGRRRITGARANTQNWYLMGTASNGNILTYSVFIGRTYQTYFIVGRNRDVSSEHDDGHKRHPLANRPNKRANAPHFARCTTPAYIHIHNVNEYRNCQRSLRT